MFTATSTACAFLLQEKKHKVKGKTLNLNDFLGTDQDAPSGYAVVNTRRINWADTMENEAVDEKFTIDYKKDEKIILPTAPKAARGPDVDMSRVPNRPPYTVYLGNLPYDVCDEDVIKFFRTLKVSSVRLPRESGDKGRMRGFGYAEFPDRSTLLEALAYNNENLKNRSIKVSLAEEHDNESRERGGGREMGRSDRELGGDWRSMPKDEGDDDRRESSFGGPPRGYDDDGGFRRSNFGRDPDRAYDSRDRPRGFGDRDQDRGYERRGGTGSSYERPREYDRGGYGGRREFGSSYSSEGRGFREGGGGGYRDSYRDDRYGGDDRDDRNDSGPPRERKKLQLKPRSVPAGEEQKQPEAAAAPPQQQQAPSQQSAPKPSAAAIFGGARPVDTAAREREIEARLARQREEEERKMVRDRDPPFQDRRDDRVRRSSVGSGSGRSRRSSESGGRDSYDEGAREAAPRQPLSRQYSNESDKHSQSSRHGPERAISPRGEQRDLARRPADRAQHLDSGPRDAHPTRNGGDRPPSKQQDFTAGRDDGAKEVVYTSRNIYAHLQPEDGGEVSD